jgi:lysophospholipase L1-like esterase
MVLFFIVLYFPPKGIHLTDDISLKFITYNELFGEDTVEYADITNIIDQSEEFKEVSPPVEDTLKDIDKNADALSQDTLTDIAQQYEALNQRLLKKEIHHLILPPGQPHLLDDFFEKCLNARENKELVRVMHYGDSQIEADRITAYIRNKFQKKFGGSGVGLVPLQQPGNFQFSVKQTLYGDWKRYTAFGKRDTTLNHEKYGALLSFSHHQSTSGSVGVLFTESPYAYHSVRNFNVLKAFYGNTGGAVFYEIFDKEKELLDADISESSFSVKQIVYRSDSLLRDIEIRFTPKKPFDVYGLSLESSSGIIIDNIPLRGSSGIVFTKINQDHLERMYSLLEPSLIILQFGGNVVPYIHRSAGKYGNWFSSQLKLIKELNPATPVIVIGVADMSTKIKGKYVSYPAVDEVRNVMKEAALNNGCAYWDMLEAMGGLNSMPSWVYSDPPLASKDFIHFNMRGARVISELFYNALMWELAKFEKKIINQLSTNDSL